MKTTYKKVVDYSILAKLLSDSEIDYQKISDITYAFANEIDPYGNRIGKGREAGNRFESILRYALSKSCHDVSSSEDLSKSDFNESGFDVQVKRYNPGIAQAATMAGFPYFSELKKICNSRTQLVNVTGLEMKHYFDKYLLPVDFMMVQDNKTGKTDYYLFEIGYLAKKVSKLSYVLGKNCDSIKLLDNDSNLIMVVKGGEDSQSNCFTRGVWVDTRWLEKNVKPLISNIAKKGININTLLFGY